MGAFKILVHQERQDHPEFSCHVVVCVLVSTQPKRYISRRGEGVEMAFHGGQFGGLVFGHDVCRFMTGKQLRQRRNGRHPRAQFESFLRMIDVFSLQHIPRIDAQHQERARQKCANPDVQYRSTREGLKTIAQKSVISARACIPSPTMR